MSDPYQFATSSGRKGELVITGGPGNYHVSSRVTEQGTGIVHATEHVMDCQSTDDVTRQMRDYCERNFN